MLADLMNYLLLLTMLERTRAATQGRHQEGRKNAARHCL